MNTPSSERARPSLRTAYPVQRELTTRWGDNDLYGHVNNAVYYSYVDSAVNGWLIAQGVLDIHHGPVIGLVVETGCRFHAPLAYPGVVVVGMRVGHVGRSSVRYELGLFAENSVEAAADAHFVHVYVDRVTRRPVPLPADLRAALEKLRPM